jgi:hypothetical protein
MGQGAQNTTGCETEWMNGGQWVEGHGSAGDSRKAALRQWSGRPAAEDLQAGEAQTHALAAETWSQATGPPASGSQLQERA